MPVPPHPRERERLAALQELQLLDTLPEQVFEDVVAVASALCGTPVSMFSLVDETRQWFKARLGFDGEETPRDIALCSHAILGDELLEVPDARQDARFADNPLVTSAGLRFYAGMPIRSPGGLPIGTLCVIDSMPRELTAAQRKALAALARQLEYVLFARAQILEAQDRERRVRALEVLLRETNEDAMREATLLSALMEQMPEPIMVFAPGGEILRFNKAAEESYGYSAAEAIGQKAAILQPTTGHETQLATVRQSLVKNGSFRGEVTGVTRSGVPFPVETAIRLITVEGETLGLTVNRDLRERRRQEEALAKERLAAEETLRRSEASFRLVAEHASDIISRTAPGGNILYVTPSMVRISGFAKPEVIGTSVHAFTHPDDVGAHAQAIAYVKGSSVAPFVYQHRLRCKDGSFRWVETSARPVRDGDGRLVEIHAVTRDITERKADELKLVAAREAAENASRAKSIFLGNMSHELRTPLHAILGFARVLERGRHGGLNESQTHYVRDIIESGTHMLMLVEELLELRELEDGRVRIVPRPVDLSSALNDALRMTRELVVERRHELAAPPLACLMVLADYRTVVQVLVNLLSNAIKYTPAGGHIRVVVEPGPDVVAIAVEDDGIGLSAEEQQQLFREFERLGQQHTADAPGTGLGLALARRLVTALGGDISVESVKGKGSRFGFTLPRVLAA
ncbi:MAG: sensory box protein [Labilithrix sp.]|nr:sensory box protein [Labilithrix sp.]